MKTELNVTLLEHTPDPEKVVASAARLCYSTCGASKLYDDFTADKVESFINRLVKMGHESPLEHASFTFSIEGVSRSLTHQLVRHRLASYSQRSQRYVKEDGFDYIVPPEILNNPILLDAYENFMESCNQTYGVLSRNLERYHYYEFLDSGMSEKSAHSAAEKKAIEDARYILPNACETKIVVTMNARELLHFFNQRCCNRAQWEIRECATQMLIECKKVAPNLFKDAGPRCVKGKCPEGKMSCGHIEDVRSKYSNLL